jgi:hypothetical protein
MRRRRRFRPMPSPQAETPRVCPPKLTPGITPGTPHQTITPTGHVIQSWTLAEMASAYSLTPNPAVEERHSRNSNPEYLSAEAGADWMGGITTTAQAQAILDKGWSEGAARLESLARDLEPPQAKTRKRRVTHRDEGDELRIDRALSGEWDSAWRTSKREWSAGPSTVTVVCSWGGNCYVTSEELFWQGAAAAVISDTLEAAGYNVRIVAVNTVKSFDEGRYEGTTLVTLKDESEPMRIDAVAGLICHAGIFRSFGIRSRCQMPFPLGSGYGSTQRHWTDERKEAIAAAGINPSEAILLGEAQSYGECVAEIQRVIKSIGGSSVE